MTPPLQGGGRQFESARAHFILKNMNKSTKLKSIKDKEKLSIAEKNLFVKSKEISGISIKGYNFDKGIDYNKIVDSYSSTGFQASNLGKAIEITQEMVKNDSFIFLGYTSNMISSGLREIIRWLVQNNKINVLVTTAGGVEEDFVKCLGDFKLGDFSADGSELRKKGINRIGNIFVPNSRYIAFEEFAQEVLEEIYEEQKKSGKPTTPSQIIQKLGEKINNNESIYYWAFKNQIPVYCPTIGDGAIGDNIYFFKHKHPDFILDLSQDIKDLNDTTISIKKSGIIILGAGTVKHSILNANMLRNGADYAVYINTEQEFNGSDSGASPEEAKSWGKLRGKDGMSVKVFSDATLVFPLLVAKGFFR